MYLPTLPRLLRHVLAVKTTRGLFGSVCAHYVYAAIIVATDHADAPRITTNLTVLNEAASDIRFDVNLHLFTAVRTDHQKLVWHRRRSYDRPGTHHKNGPAERRRSGCTARLGTRRALTALLSIVSLRRVSAAWMSPSAFASSTTPWRRTSSLRASTASAPTLQQKGKRLPLPVISPTEGLKLAGDAHMTRLRGLVHQ
jgi:hypothetical protein